MKNYKAEFCLKFNSSVDIAIADKCFGEGPIKKGLKCVEWYSDGDQRNHIRIFVCPSYCKYNTKKKREIMEVKGEG